MFLVSGLAGVLVVASVLVPLSASAHSELPQARLRPTATSPARPPTLGVTHSYGRYGRGWGQVKPKKLDNDGDASGRVEHIHWSSWGGPVAYGKGKTWTYKPHGGYYRTKVAITLKAIKIRRCRSTGRRAYSELIGRVLNRPGGHYGKRFLWGGNHNLCRAEHP
jgi:hypothetical protein